MRTTTQHAYGGSYGGSTPLLEFITLLQELAAKCPEGSNPQADFRADCDGYIGMDVSYTRPMTPEEEIWHNSLDARMIESRRTQYEKLKLEFGP